MGCGLGQAERRLQLDPVHDREKPLHSQVSDVAVEWRALASNLNLVQI